MLFFLNGMLDDELLGADASADSLFAMSCNAEPIILMPQDLFLSPPFLYMEIEEVQDLLFFVLFVIG